MSSPQQQPHQLVLMVDLDKAEVRLQQPNLSNSGKPSNSSRWRDPTEVELAAPCCTNNSKPSSPPSSIRSIRSLCASRLPPLGRQPSTSSTGSNLPAQPRLVRVAQCSRRTVVLPRSFVNQGAQASGTKFDPAQVQPTPSISSMAMVPLLPLRQEGPVQVRP